MAAWADVFSFFYGASVRSLMARARPWENDEPSKPVDAHEGFNASIDCIDHYYKKFLTIHNMVY